MDHPHFSPDILVLFRKLDFRKIESRYLSALFGIENYRELLYNLDIAIV